MKICFMGTAGFAASALKKLLNYNYYHVTAVYTKPYDAKNPNNNQVYTLASEHQLPIYTPNKQQIHHDETYHHFLEHKYDLIVVAEYGMIIPSKLLTTAKHGGINIHASLLPKLRGASPIHYAIYHNLLETGISIIHMNDQLDAGNIILQRKYTIDPNASFWDIYNDLSALGANSLIEAIELLTTNNDPAIMQNHNHATYTQLLKKHHGVLSFHQDAQLLSQHIKAFIKYPGSYFFYKNHKLIVKAANPIIQEHTYKIGEIIAPNSNNKKCLIIACKHNLLNIITIQKPGKKAMNIESFLLGNLLETHIIVNQNYYS